MFLRQNRRAGGNPAHQRQTQLHQGRMGQGHLPVAGEAVLAQADAA